MLVICSAEALLVVDKMVVVKAVVFQTAPGPDGLATGSCCMFFLSILHVYCNYCDFSGFLDCPLTLSLSASLSSPPSLEVGILVCFPNKIKEVRFLK